MKVFSCHKPLTLFSLNRRKMESNLVLQFLICSVLYLVGSSLSAHEFGCRDENDVIVDWYYMYKLPKDAGHKGKKTKSDGLDYVYITSNTIDDSWTESELKIDDERSIPGRTIRQLYENVSHFKIVKMICVCKIMN